MNDRRRMPALIQTFRLPAAAHLALTQIRDQLRLLAQLTEPQGGNSLDVVYLSADALAHCFDRLADEIDCVAQAVTPLES
ncbi:XAC0095 family protein [Lysobacter capsici]|uniref:XAC0095 family protein n=1 Tax=Lysobacter capsici TaxID=435897 RepID=UPI003CCCA3CF